jgi:hypothetical protein
MTGGGVLVEYHAAADRFAPLDIGHWVARFREEHPPTRRRKPVVLWRGQAEGAPLSMSWTTSRAIAEHFARRHVHITATINRREVRGVVLRAVAPPHAILANGHPRIGEPGEVIADPLALIAVRIASVIEAAA